MGNFMLKISFSKEEVIELFKLSMGEILGPQAIQDAGLSIDDTVVRDRVRAMPVGQLFDLLNSQMASQAEFIQSDAEQELISS